MSENKTIGVVGARGYVGAELLQIIQDHSRFQCAFASSTSQAGQFVREHVAGFESELRFEDLTPEAAATREIDALVLCLPDGQSQKWVDAFGDRKTVILDVGSDFRFDDQWTYGLSEHFRAGIQNAIRISNPGCYATSCQLALWPLIGKLDGTPSCFGVSGYSGAGRTPNSRNDRELLADGITPYKLVNHTHEREVSRHLGCKIRFSPHVAPFFRGISMTVQAKLKTEIGPEELNEIYNVAYSKSEGVGVSSEIPRVQDLENFDGGVVGGFSVNPDRPNEIALTCVIDNLRKGAAGQAIQNLNLALGVNEFEGLTLFKS